MRVLPEQIAFGDGRLADDASLARADFADLVKRQTRFVFQLAYAILRNTEDSEDVVQETFLKIYRAGTWRELESERGFLARVAWRTAVDRLPRRKFEQVKQEPVAVESNPEESALASDRYAAVHRLIDALPEELRQPLALSTVRELNSVRIAEIMGIPEGTVRTRLMRAREILKRKLERRSK